MADKFLATNRNPGRKLCKQRKILAIVLTVVALIFVSFGFAYAQKEVTINADGKTVKLTTFKGTVAGVLAQANIKLQAGDVVKPSAQTKLTEGMKIKVVRALPVRIVADGKTQEIKIAAANVRECLAAAKIKLNPEDRVNPALSTKVTAGMVIKVVRVTEEMLTQEEKIPYQVIYQKDANLPKGKTRVIQEGVEGSVAKLFAVTYEDGKEVKRTLVKEMIKQESQPKIIAQGTKPVGGVLTLASREGGLRYREKLRMLATAYYPDPAWSNGYTSLNMKATKGVVAVDPRVIPLRSRLYIEGYGEAIAGDVGSSVKGNRIDLCFDTKNEARNFGRRTVTVYILE